MEAIAIMRLGGEVIHLAADIPGLAPAKMGGGPPKAAGELTVLYLARIHPTKGLHRLLEWLPKVPGRIRLIVVGQSDDLAFVERCRRKAESIGGQVQVEWLGPLPHAEAMSWFDRCHLYVLPTETENHGYTIQEALVAGCPVLTSTGTPWRDLGPAGAGNTLSLDEPAAWVQELTRFCEMDGSTLQTARAAARERGQRSIQQGGAVEATRTMFKAVMRGR
jgi:glycosyltransferase involved in cell wall biosynthesis